MIAALEGEIKLYGFKRPEHIITLDKLYSLHLQNYP